PTLRCFSEETRGRTDVSRSAPFGRQREVAFVTEHDLPSLPIVPRGKAKDAARQIEIRCQIAETGSVPALSDIQSGQHAEIPAGPGVGSLRGRLERSGASRREVGCLHSTGACNCREADASG